MVTRLRLSKIPQAIAATATSINKIPRTGTEPMQINVRRSATTAIANIIP